jgi:RNA polymerase sigma-70 factor (ECF subfamily)
MEVDHCRRCALLVARLAGLSRDNTMDGSNLARFEEVWQRHRQRIWRLVARLAADVDVADDLTQEVCLRAFRAFGDFRGQASALTWFSRIAINVVNRYRERARPETILLDAPELASLCVEEAKSPEALAVNADLNLAIGSAVALLPEELRTTLILQVWEGLKYREIADILDVPISTIKWRRYEAIRRLRQELKEYAL